MWVVCKRQKIELTLRKRKLFLCEDPTYVPNKRKRLYPSPNILKRKTHPELNDRSTKKLKVTQFCLVHEEKYICDIYECSGVKKYEDGNNFMSYIT